VVLSKVPARPSWHAGAGRPVRPMFRAGFAHPPERTRLVGYLCSYTAPAMNGHVLDRLWNGWRAAYVSGSAGNAGSPETADVGEGSVFTQILDCGLDDTETNIVHRGRTCFVIMNAFPYTSGHVMVLPYRELADLQQLTPAEFSELWETVADAVVALERAYRPDGLNVGLNLGRAAGGSVSGHLHVHVVPRWGGDSNFMTAVANTRTLPEAISDSAAKIRAAWQSSS
jgi:ATP adenylyltransferase